jgi:hypothetical protein
MPAVKFFARLDLDQIYESTNWGPSISGWTLTSRKEEISMKYSRKSKIPYEEIVNGALILLLLLESKTWEELCVRYDYADPAELETNTTTMMLLKKLRPVQIVFSFKIRLLT